MTKTQLSHPRFASRTTWRTFVAGCVAFFAFSLTACGDDDSTCREGATTACECLIGGETLPGVQTCSSGSFGACDCSGDAGPDAPTDVPVDACTCTDGDTETRVSYNCGQDTRTCTGCQWGDWVETTPGQSEPECYFNEGQYVENSNCEGDRVQWRRCGATCTWGTQVSECGGGCDGTRRTEPYDAEEICVPARLFGRGGTAGPRTNSEPQHDVYVSQMYVDRHPVTLRRYQACVAAGACTRLEPWRHEGIDFDDLAFMETEPTNWESMHVWSATYEQAESFCTWDGGRLLTSAEWERMAIGRYPDHKDEPWETHLVPSYYYGGFGVNSIPPRFPWVGAVRSEQPTDNIGIDGLLMFYEWTSDLESAPSYEEEAAGPLPIDPAYPGEGPHQQRGVSVYVVDRASGGIKARDSLTPQAARAAIRCGRDVTTSR